MAGCGGCVSAAGDFGDLAGLGDCGDAGADVPLLAADCDCG